MKGVHHEKKSKEKSEKDRTTISKEIRNHCFVKPFRGNNEVNCSLLLNPPYVCNGCENSSRCKQPKMLYDAAIADHEYRFGRQYHDFQDYMELHPMSSIVEMDTVIGTTGGKGSSFAGVTQEDCTLLASHINSVPRLSLNNQSPFEAAKGFLGINNIHKLGIQQIPFDDIDLSIRLLRK